MSDFPSIEVLPVESGRFRSARVEQAMWDHRTQSDELRRQRARPTLSSAASTPSPRTASSSRLHSAGASSRATRPALLVRSAWEIAPGAASVVIVRDPIGF
jgi:hypothetical protein